MSSLFWRGRAEDRDGALKSLAEPGHSGFLSYRRSRRSSGSSTLFFLARGHRMVDAVSSYKADLRSRDSYASRDL